MTVGDGGRASGNLNVHRKALGRLNRDGLARRADVGLKQRGGRRGNREFAYFLSDSRKGEAIVGGARMCGVKSRAKAKADYGRVGLPANHTRVRNDLFIASIACAREINAGAGRTVVDVPVDGVWGEACPDFPMRGAKIEHDEGGKRLSDYDLQRAGYVAIEPDGRFRVVWPGQGWLGADLGCTYDVELEMGTRPGDVMGKVNDRAACYSRLLDLHRRAANERLRRAKQPQHLPDEFVGLPEGLVPILFWMRSDTSAKNMRNRVKEALDEGNGAVSGFKELRDRTDLVPVKKTTKEGIHYFEGGADVGRYVLFGGVERVGSAPFGPVYYPLYKYPAEHQPVNAGGRVSLAVVAREMAEARAKMAKHSWLDWRAEGEGEDA